MFGCSAVAPEGKGFDGINKDRSCTDLLCLLIFAVFCAAGAGIGVVGITLGQPESLVFGKDDNGNICGYTNDKMPSKCQQETCFFADGTQKENAAGEMKWAHTVEEKELVSIDYSALSKGNPGKTPLQYVVYPRLVEDLFDASQQVPPVTPLDVKFFGICIDECPVKAGWQCSMYGKGYLADVLGMTAWPKSLSDEDCKSAAGDTCKEQLDDCKNNGIFNPTMPVSMHKYKSEKCSSLLKSCFYSSLPHADTMFRCFPMYNNNVSYACDDNNDGLPDENFPSYNDGKPGGPPMNGEWQQEQFSESQKTMCGTMIKKSLSQQSASPNIVYEQIASTVAVLGRMISDLTNGLIPIVISGMGVSVVCGFLWLILLRYCARVFVWLTIVLVVVMETTLTIFFYMQAGMIKASPSGDTAPAPGTTSGVMMPTELQGASEQNSDVWKWAAIGMTILLVVQCIGIIAAIKKINVAAEIISEASKAVAAMRTLMAFPIFPVILICGVFMWFVYIAVCLYSVGEVSGDSLIAIANEYSKTNITTAPQNVTSANGNVTQGNATTSGYFSGVNMTASASFKDADWGKYLLVLHLFVSLWGNAFVGGFMTMTVAGAVSNWYWTKPTEGVKNQDTKFPVACACFRTVRYHLGSVAFGSGIIAAVQLARAIMMYIDSQTKSLQDKNIILKLLMKIVHCILWCFEKCIKYLTKNAYIFIAIKGSSFCGAAFNVFICLKDNMGQMVAVAGITEYLMLIGKVVIVASASFVCFMMTSRMETVSSPIMPVAVTAALSFFVASIFLEVYGIAIDTILISFCIDKKNNDGSEKKKYFMSNKMRILAGIKGDENSCYSRADDGDDDANVQPLGSEEESKPAADGDDDEADKKDEVSEAEKPSKGHFDTELI